MKEFSLDCEFHLDGGNLGGAATAYRWSIDADITVATVVTYFFLFIEK